MRSKIILLLLLLIIRISDTFSQDLHLRKHSLPVQYISASIDLIYQDHTGYIWLGSDSGLFRYDGFEYKRYDPFKGKKVTAIHDYNGRIWIGSSEGDIVILENEKIKKAPGYTNAEGRISAFASYGNHLLAATYGDGIYILDERQSMRLGKAQGLPDEFVNDLAANEKECWAATEKGLVSINKSLGINVLDTNLSGSSFLTVETNSGGHTLAADEIGRLIQLSPKHMELNSPNNQGPIHKLAFDERFIWLLKTSGLECFDRLSGRSLLPGIKRSLLKGTISNVFLDKENILWLTNSTSDFFSTNPAIQIFSSPSIHEQNVQAVLKDKSGDLWYSTSNGLYVTGSNTVKLLAAKKISTSGANVISMFESEDGTLWFGTYGQGLIRVGVSGVIRQYRTKDGLLNDNIFSITGKSDKLWIASIGGVSEFQTSDDRIELVNSYSGKEGPGSNYIYKVLIDSRNRTWFVTDGAGLSMLENGKFKRYDNEGENVYSITEDEQGYIWFTVANKGICSISPKGNLKYYSSAEGLRDNSLSSIASDGRGNIIMAGKHGIDVLNTRSGNIFYHSEELGINDLDPDINSLHKDENGDIWIGAKEKIISYTSSNKEVPIWPSTLISGISVFLNDTTGIKELPHDRNHISFSYIGLWYHDPGEVLYQVMLEGHDREWITSKNRSVTYPNLPPGQYVFKVRSSATGKFDGAYTATYNFSILSPFYRTPLFMAVMIIIVLLVVYSVIRWREASIRRAEELKKEKIEFEFETLKSQVNPHFLFNSFNTLSAIIEEDKETAVEYVEKLSDFFRNVLMQREKNKISIEEELEQLDLYIFLQKKRYRDNFNVHVTKEEYNKEDRIAPLTLQLLVENAVKHNIVSKAKPLTVHIFRSDNYIVVENNLQKKDVQEPSTGLGLENITKRYNLLTTEKIRIEMTDESYKVFIPILS